MNFKKMIFFILLVLSPTAQAGDIETSYYMFHRDTQEKSGDIIEIGIEHTGIYITSPQYTFIVRDVQGNGNFEYEGFAHAERIGKYTGKVDLKALKTVLEAIESAKFMLLDDEYTSLVTDQETVYTMVVKHGKTKIVRDYANQGPAKLHLIENLIDGLLRTAQWDPPKAKAPHPKKKKDNARHET